ncbi:FkbM family methyltransferase [Larkinella terrae]|uniref:FkbM family methyltransferase n=1 Tax=Larkinella terrae TaxID=2025311 RepID=A0A7K0EH37_9BACT|nr:FkbM family methyltransferase [Larkinella terrae]MRS61117.1 FkbM family methyltransferase [Larkinella terrae]
MKDFLINTATKLLDAAGLDGDRISFKAAIYAYKLGLKGKIDTQKPYPVNDIQLYLDENDTLQIARRAKFEELETEVLLSHVGNHTTLLDIGANIGYYTVEVARKATFGKVISFEPDPANFALLQKNVALNQVSNAVLHNAAISDRAGQMRLYKHPFNTGDYRLYNDGDFKEFVDVPTLRLDDVITEPVDMIKIDVQGFEYFALKGGEQILKQHKPLILTEFWPRGLTNSGITPKAYLDLLKDNGYQPRRVDEEQKKVVETDYNHLYQFGSKPVNKYINLLFIHPEKA